MSKWGELTPVTINQIIFEIRDGAADPDDARRLLELYCDEKAEPQHALIQHVQACIGRYLSGEIKSLESAFGITPRKKNPHIVEQKQMEIAADVLRCRLDGNAHQECLEKLAEKHRKGKTAVGECWKRHKQSALISVLIERNSGNHEINKKDEEEALRKIFGKEPWWKE